MPLHLTVTSVLILLLFPALAICEISVVLLGYVSGALSLRLPAFMLPAPDVPLYLLVLSAVLRKSLQLHYSFHQQCGHPSTYLYRTLPRLCIL